MTSYSLRFFDRAGRVVRQIDLDCDDDAHALDLIEVARHDDIPMELWDGERMVRRFGAAAG